jgi:hypothetical protein
MKSKTEWSRQLVAVWSLAMILSLACPLSLFADENEHEEGHAEEAHHKHSLGLFVGVTREHDESLSTLGIEYAYRINRLWSVGGLIERADREKNSTLAIAFAHFWPWKGLFLGGGLGRKDPGDERENTARATLGYEWEFGKGWVINAQANLDFIKDHDREEVYGIVFGKSF